ncbi:MAG: DUF305 domain-containing protein [Rhodobacteraceae bacterium]|nr:DUF305 domain-containing protein [Paracoccaceae bacterium]
MPRLTPILAACLALAFPALAQEATTGHEGHSMAALTDATLATQAFIAANDAMHKGMAIDFTGNADVDFVRGMIPHHQGAVDMARIVLDHGTDPEVRKFAESVIAAQEAEIKWMTDWLAANGG